MIYELFAFTGMLMWLLIGIASLLVIWLSASEKPGWAAFWGILASVVVFGFTDFRLTMSLTDVLLVATGYVAVGFAYGLIRWVGLVRKIKVAWQDIPTMSYAPSSDDADSHRRSLARQFRSNEYAISIPPKTSEFRSRVRTWIWFWPVSLSIWLFEDAIVSVARGIADLISRGFDGITKTAWGD